MTHPTQIFLSNPRALRVEYRLDDETLDLWWSPKAGESTDCYDRNYSSRDAHFCLLESIRLPGCGLGNFLSSEYDPYCCVLHFEKQTLTLTMPVDASAVMLHCAQPQLVDLKTDREAEVIDSSPTAFQFELQEPRYRFEIGLALGEGAGRLRHCHFQSPGQPRFVQAELAAGQALAIGCGMAGSGTGEILQHLATQGFDKLRHTTEEKLTPIEALGRTHSARHPELADLRRKVVRCLHSMMDESGGFRASLKAIYYLIWVRDSGFSFPYQAAAGWTHNLQEIARFLLDNPTTVRDEGLPAGRMFGQLIHKDLGKLEEDGTYYVIWILFTHWTQHGHLDFVTQADWDLIDESLAWLEEVTWDEQRGLYGEHFADETPTHGHRDHGWDYAIGQPLSDSNCLRAEGQGVTRNYDVYFNILMHSSYRMLAAMKKDPALLAKADRHWPELEKLLHNRTDGIPTYGEMLLEDGQRIQPPYWGPDAGASCCVWGLAMPNYTPLPDWDRVLNATMDAIIAKPTMHFVNGICSMMAAVDPWVYPEEKLIALHKRLAEETNTAGKYLPMGGAMPEKFDAPQGNLYHDIRPQGFAMGAWLGAWSALGLRRLPHGLALRPTTAFEEIENYPWQGKNLHVHFGANGTDLALEIDGKTIPGTLQLPEKALSANSEVRLIPAETTPLWLRSSVQLDEVETDGTTRRYHFTAHGRSRITFSAAVSAQLTGADAGSWSECDGLHSLDFVHFGQAVLKFPEHLPAPTCSETGNG